MLGVRETNYNYDVQTRSATWPKFSDFLKLKQWQDIDSSIREELQQRSNWDPIYHPSTQMRHSFAGIEQVEQNYSQSWQDIFVLTMLNGKRNGTYLELGASDPVYMNNTYLLSGLFDWKGISIDFRSELLSLWADNRSKDTLRILNAWEIDYTELLKELPTQVDYLQVDLDETSSLPILKKLPHSTTRFSVITFETDIFAGHIELQQQSREFLLDLGYQLLIDNVAVRNYPTNTWEPFEDWYIDPSVINKDLAQQFLCVNNATKLPQNIFTTEEYPYGTI